MLNYVHVKIIYNTENKISGKKVKQLIAWESKTEIKGEEATLECSWKWIHVNLEFIVACKHLIIDNFFLNTTWTFHTLNAWFLAKNG